MRDLDIMLHLTVTDDEPEDNRQIIDAVIDAINDYGLSWLTMDNAEIVDPAAWRLVPVIRDVTAEDGQ